MNPCIIDMCFYMGLHQAEIKIGGSDSLINMLLQQMNVYSKRGALHNKEDDIYTQMLQLSVSDFSSIFLLTGRRSI
jgi:hypothetical protein